jgi:hypothetical protein
MFPSAKGVKTTPIKARDAGQTGCLAWERNDEWRCFHPFPFGLQPKRPCAALQSLAGGHPGCVFRLAHGLFDLQRILEK